MEGALWQHSDHNLTCTLSSLLLAATGVIVAVPSAAQAAPPRPWPVIVFEGTPDQGSQVVIAGAFGNRQRQLTSGPNTGDLPRWAPSGKRILYLRGTPSGRSDVMVMGAYGRNKHQLLSGRNRFIADMAWAPGGGRVALVMSQPAAGYSDVFIYTLRTRQLTRLHANSVPDRDPASVDWSPDGKTIAFSAVDYTEDGNDFEDHDLYLIRPNGTGLRQITNTSTRDEYNPRFSPNGQQLAYKHASSTDGWSIVIADADGANPQRLRTGGGHAQQATWSPNGRHLLVHKFDRRGADVIWRVAADGSTRRFITHGREASWRPR